MGQLMCVWVGGLALSGEPENQADALQKGEMQLTP